MNFFKSVFSDEPQPSDPPTPTQSPPNPNPNPNPSTQIPSISNAWTFGSTLMKTLASKSESVIDTYRHDLKEFSSGLKKETSLIRQAVKDLPSSLEAGAAKAQESLESIGQAVDNIGNTVSEIIAQGKDSILANDSDSEYESSDSKLNLDNAKPYSRLDAQIRAIQCGLNTYCEDPEDLDEFNEWKLGFVLEEKDDEIEDLVEENEVIGEIYSGVVPGTVDHETFWRRYFYKVYKVMKAEEARAKLVKRAISGEEEELSWDVEDDDYQESGGSELNGQNDEKKDVSVSVSVSESKSEIEGEQKRDLEGKFDKLGVEEDGDKVASEGKADNGGSSQDSDFSVVSSQPSPKEEDLGWDEIEDVGSSDENKAVARGSPTREDLRRRLSVAEEDEDLSWDIEDDDEPVKS